MAHNYIVTAQKATAVSACVTGNGDFQDFVLFPAKMRLSNCGRTSVKVMCEHCFHFLLFHLYFQVILRLQPI